MDGSGLFSATREDVLHGNDSRLSRLQSRLASSGILCPESQNPRLRSAFAASTKEALLPIHAN
jgi:hypothetical protein